MSNPFGPPPNYPPPLSPSSYGHPAPPKYGPPLPPGTVKNYLIESILVLICCGGVFAIPAIVFAAQVDSFLRQGDYHGAVDASNKARLWLMIAAGIGAGIYLCCVGPIIVLQIAAVVAGAA
jgi:interferon-induced transmembrane protein